MAKPIKTSTRFFVAIALVIAFAGMISVTAIYWHERKHVEKNAREMAMIILERNLAIHRYFADQLKPVLFKTMGPGLGQPYFEPVWMSSTYAVREIDKYYREITDKAYYYKECAINARDPQNESDAFEQEFIRRLNLDPALKEFAGVREIGGQLYYVILRRGEVMEQGCLRCHSSPQAAPSELVSRYGPDRSFHRSLGEVVSAISLRIPLETAFREARIHGISLVVIFALIILSSWGALVFFGKRWIFDPLNRVRNKAMEISDRLEHLGDQIDVPAGRELADLTAAFNIMSLKLRVERDRLESRVEQRTNDLNSSNAKLRHEIDERQKIIAQLNASLQEIRTLRGILPICSFCKKIRDDKGLWKRMEEYISTHSEAEFSHGICDECLERHYPGCGG